MQLWWGARLEPPNPFASRAAARAECAQAHRVVRIARRNTLFYDEDVADLPRLVSAVYVGMKAMEIGGHGRDDARRRLVRFSTALLNLHFQTHRQIWRERSYLYNELSSLSAGWGGRDRTSEWRNQNPLPYRLATPQLTRTGGRTGYRRFLQVLPVYRERRGISTAWRGKIPQAEGWLRHTLYTPSVALFRLEPPRQLRPQAFHGNTAPISVLGSEP
jgi:hypothetical protein